MQERNPFGQPARQCYVDDDDDDDDDDDNDVDNDDIIGNGY